MTVAAYFNRRGFVHDKKAPSSGLVPVARPATMPLDGPSNDAAWRTQCLRRLAGQRLRRLTRPVFTPLGEPSNDTAWRSQCLRRLARPVFTPLGGASIYAAWRGQYLCRLVVSSGYSATPKVTDLADSAPPPSDLGSGRVCRQRRAHQDPPGRRRGFYRKTVRPHR